MPERNIEALKQVRERVLAEKVYMSSFISAFHSHNGVEENWGKPVPQELMRLNPTTHVVTEETLVACGTNACLCGWAILNEAVKVGTSYEGILGHREESKVGAKLLGLSKDTAESAFLNAWPLDLDWSDPDHQLAMIDGLIAGWYYDGKNEEWLNAKGKPLSTDDL